MRCWLLRRAEPGSIAGDGRRTQRGMKMRRLGEKLRAAMREMPPSPFEMAVATLLGGSALALSGALDIAIAVPSPVPLLRLRHHVVDAVVCLGTAAWVAGAVALLRRLERPWWSSWLAIWLAAIGAMGFILGRQLLRQANVPFDSEIRHLLLGVYLSLSGAAVPAAYLVGAFVGRLGRGGRAGGALLGVAGIAVGHLVLRDDYPGVHAAILWVAATLFGASLARLAALRLSADRRSLIVVSWLALASLLSPDNAVRCELFRQPGAVSAWVLARAWWSPPELSVERPAPSIALAEPELFERARRGLGDDPIVILITVDALRADVIASGRYDARLPTLTRLRESGVFFSHAIAPGSQTSVSLTSVFTGRYYSQLRYAYYGAGRSRYHYAASDPSPRFVEALEAGGVETTAVLAINFLAAEYGVTRGFSNEIMATDGRGHAHAPAVMTPLLEAIRGHRQGPAFYFAHLTEPHEPYDRAGVTGTAFERYVAEVAIVDGWLDRLIRALGRRRAFIIVTADHGEAFGEHDRYFHTKSLYEEMVAVPLIISGPGLARRRIDQTVSLVDLGRTVLHLFGLPPLDGSSGRSLLPTARGLVEPKPSPVFAEGRLQRAYWRGDGLKVIEDSERKTVEVYDLSRDPLESTNIFERDPRAPLAVAELRAFFARHALSDYEPPYKP